MTAPMKIVAQTDGFAVFAVNIDGSLGRIVAHMPVENPSGADQARHYAELFISIATAEEIQPMPAFKHAKGR